MANALSNATGAAAIVVLGEIDSTNSEAMRRAFAGEAGPLWIRAEAQSRGRGRSGRSWTSPPGNLYATLLFVRDVCRQRRISFRYWPALPCTMPFASRPLAVPRACASNGPTMCS